MALTAQQRRRRRDTIIGVIAVLVLASIPLGPALVQMIVVPDMPGYVKKAPAGNFISLDWSKLLKSDWPARGLPVIQQDVKAQDGQMVTIHGFMLPLHQAGVSSEFFVSQKPRGCYYCNPPGIAEVVKIRVAGDKQMTPTDWPVKAYGKFHVASGPKDDSLYWMDDAVLMATPQ